MVSFLEVFLREQTQTVDFVEYMEKIERACNLENGGSQTYKYLHILVISGIFFIIYSCIMVHVRDQLVNILIKGREGRWGGGGSGGSDFRNDLQASPSIDSNGIFQKIHGRN